MGNVLFLMIWAVLLSLMGCEPLVVKFDDPGKANVLVDTADTGDSGDTGKPPDSGDDTSVPDTGDSGKETGDTAETGETGDTTDTAETGTTDADGDGWTEEAGDCDDEDSQINPGAVEVCDSADNNCDHQVDEGVQYVFYADVDGDGYGDSDLSDYACTQPTGYVVDNTDCADNDAADYPGAAEICDGADNNCDGVTDEGPVDGASWYADVDSDGYGDPGVTQVSCTEPSGYVADNTDCDDSNSASSPVAPEYCNGSDDDCDGTVDEDDSLDAGTWYADVDSDGYGDMDVAEVKCSADVGYVVDDSDCNDAESAINPDAVEVCDGADNNCDGVTDEGPPTDAATWYGDTDGDGYGDPRLTQVSCTEPSGYVAGDTDCDDTSAAIFPGAAEVCDGADNNCDGSTDTDPTDGTTYYADSDGDTYGDSVVVLVSCSQPSGYVEDDSDCDDADAGWHWACTDCERELVDAIGFSEDQVWPGDLDSDVSALVYVDSSSTAISVGMRWVDVYGEDWVVCGDVDYTETVPFANFQLQSSGAYLGFGWYATSGSVAYVVSSDLTSALVGGAAYANYGDYYGNALFMP